MNTNELKSLEKYHLHMAEILASHVAHHKHQASNFRNRRLKLKEQIIINSANKETIEIIKALTEK